MATDTDRAWKHFGKTDPYWAVVTAPQYRRDQLTDAGLAEFFAIGERHVEFVLDTIRSQFDESFVPWSCLDFGCGVGRLTIPFAQKCRAVVGVDVSEDMLEEARKNCARFDVANVEFATSDDRLSQIHGKFDLVHSFIVLQHLHPARGERLIHRLIERVADHGFGVLHVIFSKRATRVRPPGKAWLRRAKCVVHMLFRAVKNLLVAAGHCQPTIDMNAYDLNSFFILLQAAGIRRSFVQFTDHGGEYGVLLFFRKQPGEGYAV